MFLVLTLTVFSCKKEIPPKPDEVDSVPTEVMPNLDFSVNGNPYSVPNVLTALNDLGRGAEQLEPERIYHYYSFDPTSVSTEAMTILSNDDFHIIQDFPFGDASLWLNRQKGV